MKLQSSHVHIDLDSTVLVHSIVPFVQNDEVILACNDKTIYHCNLLSKKISSQPITLNSCPLTLAWQPLSLSQRLADSVLAVGCSDGSVEFFQAHTNGQEEWPLRSIRKIKAHDGSVTSICWSHDDSSLATSGVDGEVKIWSRVGHLRIKLASFDTAVNALSWGPRCESIVIAQGRNLSLTQVHGRGESICWGWNSGIILALDWNIMTDTIVSGDEDGVFRISTSEGVCLYSSKPHNHPITTLSWFPNGEYFAIGSFGNVQLCDTSGNIHDQLQCSVASSVLQMNRSQDTSQLIGGCSSGEIVVLNLVGLKKFWGEVSVELLTTNSLKVTYPMSFEDSHMIDIASGMIINFDISFGTIVVLTRTQCHIYCVNAGLDNPISIDLKEDSVYNIVLGPSNLAVIGWNGLRVYSYQGKYLSSPNYQFTSSSKICSHSITIGDNVLAIVDDSDAKVVRLFSCENGEPLEKRIGKITHEINVKQIYLSQMTSANEQYLLMIDAKENLFIRPVIAKYYGQEEECKSFKLGTHIKTAAWDEKGSMVCCLEESRAIFYYFPTAPFVDVDLLKETRETIDLGETIKCAKVESMCHNRCVVALQNESIIHVPISEGHSLLNELASVGAWQKCIRLCQFRNNPTMWAVLALEGIRQDELAAAESGLLAIKAVEKLEHLRSIRKMPKGERKSAELSLYKRKPKEAISILLGAQPPLIYDALMTCIRMFRWKQALEIVKGKEDSELLDIVLWYRSQYLQKLNQKEDLTDFRVMFRERKIPSSKEDFTALENKVKHRHNASTRI